jgi:GDP-4-dehydro-6-deoxy-D-mannose reductase
MRVLITGITGFVGRHLAAELAGHGHVVFGFDLGTPPACLALAAFHPGDILDGAALRRAVAACAPDACVHLAGCAFVPAGTSAPVNMVEVNLMGTLQVLEAFRETRPAARLLVVSSAHVYGNGPRPAAIVETDPLAPDSFYAVAKAGADTTARLYAAQFGMPVLVSRPFNHIGPGQSPLFVVASFAQQVKAIAAGGEPVIKVGNLDSRRDFTDVRDVARAYRLLLERGRPGSAYNIASGHLARIGDILQRLCELAGVNPRIVQDAARFRPDRPAPVLDTARLRSDTGWEPAFSIEQTLRDVLAAS